MNIEVLIYDFYLKLYFFQCLILHLFLINYLYCILAFFFKAIKSEAYFLLNTLKLIEKSLYRFSKLYLVFF